MKEEKERKGDGERVGGEVEEEKSSFCIPGDSRIDRATIP